MKTHHHPDFTKIKLIDGDPVRFDPCVNSMGWQIHLNAMPKIYVIISVKEPTREKVRPVVDAAQFYGKDLWWRVERSRSLITGFIEETSHYLFPFETEDDAMLFKMKHG